MPSDQLTGPALDAAVEKALGDDLSCFAPDGSERRERIEDAAGGWWNSQEHPHAIRFDMGWSLDKHKCSWIGYLWDNRAGWSWQAALEAHVAVYRAAPRPFHCDLTLAVWLLPPTGIVALNDLGVCVSLAGGVEERAKFAEFPDAADDEERRVLAFCHAVCRAVLAVRS